MKQKNETLSLKDNFADYTDYSFGIQTKSQKNKKNLENFKKYVYNESSLKAKNSHGLRLN